MKCTVIVLGVLFAAQTLTFVESFAAKRNRNNKKAAASTNRGFGVAPPTYEEVLGGFRTRFHDDDVDKDCPCGSGGTYGECCRPIHVGERMCESPTDVLRSRYTAFRFRNIGYIQQSTHPECRDYTDDKIAWARSLNRQGMFDSYEFVELDIVSLEEAGANENESFVSFRVVLKALEAMAGTDLKGKTTTVSERSRFLRDPTVGSWSYAGGKVRSEEPGLKGTSALLN